MYDPDYKPRLYDANGDVTKRWYIDFRVWDTDQGCFVRKQYTGMNKYRTLSQRRRAAKQKLNEITALVAAGYTAGKSAGATMGLDPHRATVLDAVKLVASVKAGTGRSGEQYGYLLNRLQEERYQSFAALPLRFLKTGHVLDFLERMRKTRGYGPQTHNGYRGTLAAVFNYLVQLEALPRNPISRMGTATVPQSDQHQPYTPAQRAIVQAEIEHRGDRQLLLFISFIYYCFIRSGEELRRLQIKDVLADTVRIPGGRAKNRKAEHVAIPRQLRAMLAPLNLAVYPANYYVFGENQQPGPVPVGTCLLRRHFNRVLRAVGLHGLGHTLYSFKHTGAISLYLATNDIELVRKHCRHSHAGITAIYLRKHGALHEGARLDAMPDF